MTLQLAVGRSRFARLSYHPLSIYGFTVNGTGFTTSLRQAHFVVTQWNQGKLREWLACLLALKLPPAEASRLPKNLFGEQVISSQW